MKKIGALDWLDFGILCLGLSGCGVWQQQVEIAELRKHQNTGLD